VGEALYAVETEPEFKLLGDAGQLRGASATIAAGAKARIDHLWQLYPVLTEGVDRLERAVGADDRPGAWRLLAPAAVTLPDGARTSIAGLAAGLEADLAEARAAVRRLGEAWRAVVPRADRLVAEVRRLTDVADELGLAGDRELAAARRLTEGLAITVASDPVGVDLGTVERAVDRARTTIDGLAGQRHTLPAELARAAAELSELDRLVAAGAEALATARTKVQQTAGLLQPLDPDQLDGDERTLRPWLGRIQAMADRGDWRAAAAGLARWRRVADGWLANARAVIEANRAPVRRRDELRGLLDAYRAKAAAAGVTDDPEVTERFQVARAALERTPCDLAGGAVRVDEYMAAVNGAISGT
jgi:hypothetical protein